MLCLVPPAKKGPVVMEAGQHTQGQNGSQGSWLRDQVQGMAKDEDIPKSPFVLGNPSICISAHLCVLPAAITKPSSPQRHSASYPLGTLGHNPGCSPRDCSGHGSLLDLSPAQPRQAQTQPTTSLTHSPGTGPHTYQ